MGIKNLLKLFVDVEEDPVEKKAAPEVKPAVAVTAAPEVVSQSVLSGGVQGESNETILNNLAAALEAANLPGYDYFEFAKTLDALNAIPAEQVRYQTAFTTGAVMGATKQGLLDSSNHYLKVLEEESKKFESLVQDQVNETISNREQTLIDIDNSINQKAAEIQRLTDEINAQTNDRTMLLNEVEENRLKIQKVKNDFGATMHIFVDRIGRDVEKINKYLN